MDLERKYQILFERASSPKSLDVGRATIFLFEKYCKHCGQGMRRPPRYERRAKKALWGKGYCRPECQDLGARDEVLSSMTVKGGTPSHKNEHTVEEMAFIALELKRRDNVAHPVVKLILKAKQTYRLLSEQLGFLERYTGEKWTPGKFFYWAGKI